MECGSRAIGTGTAAEQLVEPDGLRARKGKQIDIWVEGGFRLMDPLGGGLRLRNSTRQILHPVHAKSN